MAERFVIEPHPEGEAENGVVVYEIDGKKKLYRRGFTDKVAARGWINEQKD